jgi:hypothetical protein
MSNDNTAPETIRAVLQSTGWSRDDCPSPLEKRMLRVADPEALAEIGKAFQSFVAGFVRLGQQREQ